MSSDPFATPPPPLAQHPHSSTEWVQQPAWQPPGWGEQSPGGDPHAPGADIHGFVRPGLSPAPPSAPSDHWGAPAIPGPVDPFGRDPLGGGVDHDPFGHPPVAERPGPVDPDEVLWRGHPTIRGLLGWYLKGLLVSAVLSALVVGVWYAGFIGAGFATLLVLAIIAGYLGLGMLIRRTSSYWFTRRTVHARFGIILRQGEEAHTQAIRNVIVTQTIIERILRVGTVNFDTAGEHAASHTSRAHQGDILRFRGIANPWEVAARFRNHAPPTVY